MTLEKILESIVDPSKEIKEGFQTYRLATADGQVHTGLKITEDAKEVVIRDANGRDIRVAKDDVDSLAPSKVSLMPDNVVAQISYEQFIDLLAFLKSRKEQESLRGLVAEIAVTGPFPARPRIGEAGSESRAPSGRPLHAEPNGKIDLKPRSPASGSAVYVRAYVFSPKKQSATVTASGENPLRVWVNDESTLYPHERGLGSRRDVRGRAEGGVERASGEGGERRQAGVSWACGSPATDCTRPGRRPRCPLRPEEGPSGQKTGIQGH